MSKYFSHHIMLKRWTSKFKSHQSEQAFVKILRYHEGHILGKEPHPRGTDKIEIGQSEESL